VVFAGKIYPLDTFNGFHRIGFNVFLSAFAVLVIHGTFSWPSQVVFRAVFSMHLAVLPTCALGLKTISPAIP
jgi:hypothetical protein